MVFVYGTLRQGASNHFRLEGATTLGEAWVLGQLYRIDWYPGLLLDDDGIPVRGEIYAVEREMLRKLDDFEGREYERLKITVHLKDGGEVEAWLYEYRGKIEGRMDLIPADWMARGEDRRASSPGAVCSGATFALLPLTVGGGILTLGMEVSGPRWFGLLMWLVITLLPLIPFVTGRWARKRREKWAQGAEVCAALAFVAFWILLIVRHWPAAFEAFPNQGGHLPECRPDPDSLSQKAAHRGVEFGLVGGVLKEVAGEGDPAWFEERDGA